MALTENTKISFFADNSYRKRAVASGAIHFYTGAICNLNTSGYLKLGSDTASETFAGIATKELDQAAAAANGDNSLTVLAAKSGNVVKLTLTGVTIADIGQDVFVSGDDEVSITTLNFVRVGTIFDIGDANEAYVLLD